MNKEEIVNKIVGKIKAQYQPEKIILFGSYAWGKPTKDSDIDLFIVKNTTEKHRERALKVRRILSEENALVGIDILVYTPEELAKRLEIADSFINKIIKKGKLVYG
ncbi:MAG: nucleotidyltransferase domain-containing protein [Candidatus Omnitrophica bacterium]|nr:nucleotidyltransferase domain-containing protein [Candidatus Omnitrophota bacterium]